MNDWKQRFHDRFLNIWIKYPDIAEGAMIEFIEKEIQEAGKVTSETSDGYHTFNELYEHRIALFITLSNVLYSFAGLNRIAVDEINSLLLPWKSRKHSDGSEMEGWFIAGIGTKEGSQLTYHLPNKVWDKLKVVAYDKAPKWDGHTPNDVIKRLYNLTLSEEGKK